MPLPCRILRTTTMWESACVTRTNHGVTGAASGTRHNMLHIGQIALNISSTAAFQLPREAQRWGKGGGIGSCWRSGETIGARVKGALSNVFQLCLHIYLGVMFKVKKKTHTTEEFCTTFIKIYMARLSHAIFFEGGHGLLVTVLVYQSCKL